MKVMVKTLQQHKKDYNDNHEDEKKITI
jgi:hypothetical protein